MSKAAAFVVGYHGCDERIGRRILDGEEMMMSERAYDWLGKGVYFWENDYQRALEWAKEKEKIGDYNKAFVIGALIDLGNCLDLTLRENHEFLRSAYAGYRNDALKDGKMLLENKDADDDANGDKLLRFLDCAVINYLHSMLGKKNGFDTVRGMFVEGKSVYDGARFREKTHTQIAVYERPGIRAVFLPRIS